MRVKEWIDQARGAMSAPEPRKGSASPRLNETEFKRRFRSQFQDQAFEPLEAELGRIAEAAWDAYAHERKSPHTRKAGPGYANPDYDLCVGSFRPKARVATLRAYMRQGERLIEYSASHIQSFFSSLKTERIARKTYRINTRRRIWRGRLISPSRAVSPVGYTGLSSSVMARSACSANATT